MKWIEQKEQFQKAFDELAQINIKGLITELNKATNAYIQKGGISANSENNPDYTNILYLTKRVEDIKKAYSKLNDDIITYLSNESKSNDLSGLLVENGELQKQLHKLEKIQDEMKIDVESSIARDEILRSRDTNLTRHSLFILDRPIRKGIVPYLWVIGVIFIGVGLIIFRMTLPYLIDGSNLLLAVQMTIEYVTNRNVLGAILIAALIVILFLSLKIGGVFG